MKIWQLRVTVDSIHNSCDLLKCTWLLNVSSKLLGFFLESLLSTVSAGQTPDWNECMEVEKVKTFSKVYNCKWNLCQHKSLTELEQLFFFLFWVYAHPLPWAYMHILFRSADLIPLPPDNPITLWFCENVTFSDFFISSLLRRISFEIKLDISQANHFQSLMEFTVQHHLIQMYSIT